MGLIKGVFSVASKVVGKTVRVATVTAGEIVAGTRELAARNPNAGEGIRAGAKTVGEHLDRGASAIGEGAGSVTEKAVEVVEKTAGQAVELCRPIGRAALTKTHDVVTSTDFKRKFVGFKPSLDSWTEEEAETLLAMWRIPGTSLDKPRAPIENVKGAIEHFSSNAVGLLVTSSPVCYERILKKAVRVMKLESGESTEAMEDAIISSVWSQIRSKLDAEQLRSLQDALRQRFAGDSSSTKVRADIAATLTAAQLSGFGVYLAATSIVGAMTHLVGVTAPFAFYSAMTSTIATLIGPLGFAAAGLLGIAGASGKNWDKLIPFVIYSRAIRESKRVASCRRDSTGSCR